jgi:DNA-binding response OmpR family regulator
MQPILVVEDDARFRSTVRTILEDEGWVVETAADGQQAAAAFARERPALLILDWGLRETDAETVVAALRVDHGADVPILLVTADGHAAQKAARVGAFAYMHKPFEMTELIELVRRGLGTVHDA